MTDQVPVPAATVVLMREATSNDTIEVLLLQRNSKLVFHGGHWVFPGGRIDAEDYRDEEKILQYPAAKQAAVRETYEEAGIVIDEADLIHTAHWTTPPKLPRRFSTWFFMCAVASDTAVQIDNSEIHAYSWLSPSAALAESVAGKKVFPGPTKTTLQSLQGYSDMNSLLRDVRNKDIHVYPSESPFYKPREMGFTGT